jgi:hypothetical protein
MRMFRRKLYEERHGMTLANKYRNQSQSIARLMASRERSKRLVVHPRQTPWFGYWDVVTTLALLYTAIITPFEAGFLGSVYGPAAWADIWFLINRVLDLVFLFDLVLQFFVAYETRDDRGGSIWVEDHSLIMYIRMHTARDPFSHVTAQKGAFSRPNGPTACAASAADRWRGSRAPGQGRSPPAEVERQRRPQLKGAGVPASRRGR